MSDTIEGWVAVLTPELDAVDHVEFIGAPTTFKPGRVLPLVDEPPNIPAGFMLGAEKFTIENARVVRTWSLDPAPLPDLEPYQFFAMLELSGKKVPLMAYIDALPVPANVIARAKLEHTLVFHRENDLVLAAQSVLGLTDQQLDALWNQAAAIK